MTRRNPAPCDHTLQHRIARKLWCAAAMCAAMVAVGCGGTKPPADGPATDPAKATTEPSKDKGDKGGDKAGDKGASAAPSTSAAADIKAPEPKEEAIPVADFDPGDSGAFNLGGHHVSPVVKANRKYLTEYCWSPAVRKNLNGPKKASVASEVEVKPDGTVAHVKSAGDANYPELAPCVEKHIKRWRFPKAKGTSSLLFPVDFQRSDVDVRVVDSKDKK